VTASALYPGQTWHRRRRPVEHYLSYRLFMMLLDLDEAAALDRSTRHFGYNRSRLLSFHDRDHGDGSTTPLRAQIEAELARVGVAAGGAIRVLCMPRVFGQAFNPLTVYYCYPPGETQTPAAVLYEVNNTFGQRHSYLLTAETGTDIVTHDCDKLFFVSPFMDMALRYRFRLRPPGVDAPIGEPLAIRIDVDDAEGLILSAEFTARREPISDAAMLRQVLAHPLLMIKVVGAIHWEAVKLWLKGLKLRPRPAVPDDPVTVIGPKRSGAA